jgi:mannose-6-phosphate isomerase
VKLEPFRIDPTFVPRIWGARSLAPLFPDRSNEKEPIGEVWLTGMDCGIATGPFAGKSLGEAWHEMGPEWTGRRLRDPEYFPLLVKFIFPEDKLSIQVHPEDDYARQHELAAGGRGKTEMWYAISARDDAELMLGLRPGVTREEFRRALSSGTVEECLEHVRVRTADAIFVPSGTAHSIGPGMVLCEIQEYSDITYRVFDYNRLTADGKQRELHIEKALDVIHFGKQKGGKLEPVANQRGPLTETFYVDCNYFATERWEFREPVAVATDPAHFDLLITLAGSGRIETGGKSHSYAPAQVWFMPAGLGNYRLAPEAPTTLLSTYVPELGEFRRMMKERGISDSAVSRLVKS